VTRAASPSGAHSALGMRSPAEYRAEAPHRRDESRRGHPGLCGL